MTWRLADFATVVLAWAGVDTALRLLLRFRHRLPQDIANERSLHQGTVPRVGGIALWVGGLLAAGSFVWSGREAGMLAVVVPAATALALMSYLDDRHGLAAGPRLLGHMMAAGLVIYCLSLPLWATMGLVVALAWMTNLYNFMDGADGLAGGMALAGFSVYGLGAAVTHPSLALASFVIAAAAAGFLAFNFHPAKVFMGDAGSIPLGFLAGALGLMGWHVGAWPIWFPVLVFSPFIMDASVTLLRRLLRRERIWQAHRDHYYQRLVRLGWGHRRTALAEYGLILVVGASALAMLRWTPASQGLGLLGWLAIYGGLAYRVDKAWEAGSR